MILHNKYGMKLLEAKYDAHEYVGRAVNQGNGEEPAVCTDWSAGEVNAE